MEISYFPSAVSHANGRGKQTASTQFLLRKSNSSSRHTVSSSRVRKSSFVSSEEQRIPKGLPGRSSRTVGIPTDTQVTSILRLPIYSSHTVGLPSDTRDIIARGRRRYFQLIAAAKVHSCETICVENQSTQIDLNALPNCADVEDVIVQESAKVLSPVVVRRKGRPPSKRKMSTVDKIVQKLKERKKKQYRTMPKEKTKRAEKSKRGEDTNSSRITNDFGIQANSSCNFGSHSVNISPASDNFRTVNDICTQGSMDLMENQGFFSNGGFMAPQHPLNFMAPQNSLFQLQEYSQKSRIGDQTQLWHDNYGINIAEKQYWNSSSIGGRVSMPDFIVNSSQAKTNHPSL